MNNLLPRERYACMFVAGCCARRPSRAPARPRKAVEACRCFRPCWPCYPAKVRTKAAQDQRQDSNDQRAAAVRSWIPTKGDLLIWRYPCHILAIHAHILAGYPDTIGADNSVNYRSLINIYCNHPSQQTWCTLVSRWSHAASHWLVRPFGLACLARTLSSLGSSRQMQFFAPALMNRSESFFTRFLRDHACEHATRDADVTELRLALIATMVVI